MEFLLKGQQKLIAGVKVLWDFLDGSGTLIFLAADCRCVCGGGHCGSHSQEAAQDVQEDQAEAEGAQAAVGLPAECAAHHHHHLSSGVRGGGHHMVTALGLCL